VIARVWWDDAMQLTKYGHSCVRLEDGGRALLIDPGVFSDADAALAGVSAVLITHEHVDHLDVSALTNATESNDALQVWAPAPVAAQLGDLGARVTAVDAGESFKAAGFDVRVVGGKHAVIHPDLGTPCDNVGYVIDESLYHPGDAFHVPPMRVETLLVPLHAPWSKTAEVIDFVVAVRPQRAFQIHDALLSEPGTTLATRLVTQFAAQHEIGFQYLELGSDATI